MYVIIKPGAGGPAFLRFLFITLIKHNIDEVEMRYIRLNKKTGLYVIPRKYLRDDWRLWINPRFGAENIVFTVSDLVIVNADVIEIKIKRKTIEVDKWTKLEVLEVCQNGQCKDLPLGPGAYRYLKSRVSQ